MKKYAVFDNGSYHIIGPDSHPPTIYDEFYDDIPDGLNNDDGDIIKVVDGIVTIDQIKKAAKDEAKQSAKDSRAAEKLQNDNEISDVKNIDIDLMIDNMDKTQLKKVFKLLLKKIGL